MNGKKWSLSLLMGLTTSLSAFAHQPGYPQSGYNADWSTGWYIGAGINGDATTENSTSFPGYALDKTEGNLGFDIYTGRKVADYFAFEIGYSWLGNQEFKGSILSDTTPAETTTFSTTVRQWNVHTTGLLMFPVADYFSVFGKLGVAYYQNETENYLNATSTTSAQNETDELHTFAVTYGAGAQLAWDQFGLRAEYTVVRPNDYDRDVFYISDVISASLFYRFM